MMKKIIIPQIEKVEKANDFIGIKIVNGKIYVYVPAFFHEDENEKILRRDILLFLKSISIAKSVEYTPIQTTKDRKEKSIWPIESFLWLIQDYLQNDVFYNREKKYFNDGKGKFDWKKTLKNDPIMSDGNIIYDKIVSSRISPVNGLISQIYKICIFQSQVKIGWLFGYNLSLDVQQICSVKEMIYHVTNEMRQTYDDVKKLRYSHMLKVLKNVDGENALSRNCTYGIENYYYVFEVMVDCLFKGIPPFKRREYNPMGYWLLEEGEPFVSSNLRLDTLHKRGDELFIIDAKMYQYGVTKDLSDLPATSSMQKQITYGDYVKKISPKGTKIRNAFILPYDKTLQKFRDDANIVKLNNHNLAYIGQAYVSWRNEKEIEDYDYIFTFLVDFNYLLNWYKKEDTTSIDALCEEITKRLELKKR